MMTSGVPRPASEGALVGDGRAGEEGRARFGGGGRQRPGGCAKGWRGKDM